MIESIWNIPIAPVQLKYNSNSKPSSNADFPAMIGSYTPRSQPVHMRSPPRLLQRSQALTERERRLAFKLTNDTGSQTPRFGLKRSKTLLERPEQVYKPRKWYSEPSTVDYIRHLRNWNKETEAKLRETANVLRMQRSRSDLDVRAPDAQGFGLIHGSSMIKDSLIDSASFSQILDVYKHEDSGQVGKQEVKISKAVVPRRGLIQLSTDDKDLHVTGGKQITPTQESKQQGSGKTHPSLIRRKDILEQVKLGTKLLEEYEEKQKEEEEMTKSLGEYTMLDLQSHILGLTDARGLKRESVSIPSSEPLYKELHKEKQPARGKKPVVLPAINTLNPFG